MTLNELIMLCGDKEIEIVPIGKMISSSKGVKYKPCYAISLLDDRQEAPLSESSLESH